MGLTGESWKAAAPYLDLIAPQHWNEEINTQVYKHSPHPTDPEGLAQLDEHLRSLWEKYDIKAHLKGKRNEN